MLRSRLTLLLAALLLTSCDHHKPANQAQAEAGAAPVAQPAAAQTDSALTGLPPQPANPSGQPYPRATLVALPSPSDTSASTPDSTPSAPPTTPPSTPPDASATAASSPSPAPEPMASSSSAPPPTQTASPPPIDADMPRLKLNPTAPVIATNLPPAADDDSASERVVVLTTPLGRIVIQLSDMVAPKTCDNFRKLVSDGFYNHTVFHRVIPNFIIQGGDPNSKGDERATYGQGGPGYTLPAEIKLKHDRGAVAMARLPDSVNPQRESNGSQFFICVAACPSLDATYTVFGHVIKGMDVADKIANLSRDPRDNPLGRMEMEATLEPRGKALAEDTSNP